MVKKNFFVDGGTVQAQEGAIYLSRTADEQLLSLCRQGSFAYVLAARQMGKSSLMVNTEERLAADGIRWVEIDLTRIGWKVTREEWYLGILFEIQLQLDLKQDVTEWWHAKERSELSTAHRILLFFEEVMLAEISEPIIIFVDEIETTLRLDFTDDFFAAVRSVHNARSGHRFERLAFVLIGAATPDSLIRDQQLTPFNIGQSVLLSDFTFEEARPLAGGFGISSDDAERILRRVLHWSGGHPYLTQRCCRVIAERNRTTWTDAEVDEVVAQVFLDDQRDEDKNLRFVREMLLTSELNQEDVLTTYRDILREGRPVLDDEQSLIKSHLKLSGVVKRKGKALQVRNPIYRQAFDESWVKNNIPINWYRRLTRVAFAALLTVLIFSTILAPLAWSQKVKAERIRKQVEVALETEKNLRRELEKINQQLGAAKEEAEQQSRKAEGAAQQAKVAKEEAEAKGVLFLKERDRARLSETARTVAQKDSFVNMLIAKDGLFHSPSSLVERVIVAKEAYFQAREAEVQKHNAGDDNPLSVLAYQNLVEGVMLLPRSTLIPFGGARISDVKLMNDGQTLVGLTKGSKTLRTWDLKSHKASSHEVAGLSNYFGYSRGGRYIAMEAAGSKAVIRDLQNGREFVVVSDFSKREDRFSEPNVIFSPDENYAAVCPCINNSSVLELWNLKEARKVSDLERTSNILNLKFGPDGKSIYTVNRDGTIHAFETHSGSAIPIDMGEKISSNIQSGVEGPVTSPPGSEELNSRYTNAAFSQNGAFVVISTIKDFAVWNLSNVQAVRRTRVIDFSNRRETRLRGLAVSNDGGLVTIQGETSTSLELWDVVTNRLEHTINTASIPYSTYFSSNGRSFVTASDSLLQVWDIHSGWELYRAVVGEGIESIDQTADGNSVVTVDGSGAVRLWEIVGDENSVRKLISFDRGAADLSRDGQYLVAVDARSETAQVWDLRTGQPIATRKFEQVGNLISISPDGAYVAVLTNNGAADHTIWLWNWKARGENASKRVTFAGKSLSYLSLSRDGKHASVLFDRVDDSEHVLRVWALNEGSGTAKHLWDKKAEAIRAPFFLDHPDQLVITTKTGTTLWNVVENRTIGDLLGRNSDDVGAFSRVIFSYDYAYIANYSKDAKTVEIAETKTGTIVRRLSYPNKVKTFDLSSNGELLATGGEDGIVRVWEWKGEWRVLSEVKYTAESITISRNGKYMATGGDSLRIWDISRPGEIKEVARIQPTARVADMYFSPDDEYVYAIENSGLLSIWKWRADLICEATKSLNNKEFNVSNWIQKVGVREGELSFLDRRSRSFGCEVTKQQSPLKRTKEH